MIEQIFYSQFQYVGVSVLRDMFKVDGYENIPHSKLTIWINLNYHW